MVRFLGERITYVGGTETERKPYQYRLTLHGTVLLCASYRRQRSYQRCLGSVLHLQSRCTHNVGSRPCAYLFSAPAYDPPACLGFPSGMVFLTDFHGSETAGLKRGVLGTRRMVSYRSDHSYYGLPVHLQGKGC